MSHLNLEAQLGKATLLKGFFLDKREGENN
jgi:hypothetical protein